MRGNKEGKREEEVIDVTEEIEEAGEEAERRNLKEYLNTVIYVRGIEERRSEEYGYYYIIKLVDNTEAYTFSKKVAEQSALLKSLLQEGKVVRTKVALNKRNQVYFSKP